MKRSLLRSVSTLFSMTDEQAMWRVRVNDDPLAFAQLLRHWEGPIQRLCTRMLGDPHRAQDLTQDTFAKLFAKRKDYEPTGRFSTYLWRVALNLCYDELRRVKRRPECPLDDPAMCDTDEGIPFQVVELGADTLTSQKEESELVRQAVLQLSGAYRAVVVLRHYENLKFREIAEVLNIPEGTVKSRMAEALTQLHRLLANAFPQRNSDLCKTHSRRMETSVVL